MSQDSLISQKRQTPSVALMADRLVEIGLTLPDITKIVNEFFFSGKPPNERRWHTFSKTQRSVRQLRETRGATRPLDKEKLLILFGYILEQNSALSN